MQEVYNQQRAKEEPSSAIQTGKREVEGKKPERACLAGLPCESPGECQEGAEQREEASICFSWDVGQCAISSKRWVGIRAANNSEAGETRAKLKEPLQGVPHAP